MTTPDPADLRLAAALAELGRTTVLAVAARAGMHPEEAAVRLLRMGNGGLPLVVGVEGDRAGLHQWASAWQAAAPGWGQQPQRWGQQPQAWEAPQSTGRGPAGPEPSAAPALAWVGEPLTGHGPAGEELTITVVDVVDTADALIAAAGHQLPPGRRATVVHTEVVAGPRGYHSAPDTHLTVVLADGTEVNKSDITLSSRPPFHGGANAGEGVGGHTVFELDAQATISGVRWRAAPDAPALEWRTR